MDYFKETLEDYYLKLDELLKIVEFIILQKELFNTIKLDKKMQKFADPLKNVINSSVQYNSIIISLYSCFELFINKMAIAYIKSLTDIYDNYQQLPVKIKKAHLKKISEFLGGPKRFKGLEITPQECISNLYHNIVLNKKDKIDVELITHHQGNFNVDKIIEFFENLGIKEINKISKDKEGVRYINKIVEERNIISHSFMVVSDRFNIEINKKEVVEFFKRFGKKLKKILTGEINKLKNKINLNT